MIEAFPPLLTVLGILGVFLVAGTVKGALGIGFPAVAMSMLTVIIAPSLGVALLALPIFVTNIIQFTSVAGWPAIVRRFLWAGISLAVMTFIVVQFLDDVPSRWINVVVGFSLVFFSLAALFKVDLRVTESRGWQLFIGISSGFFSGVSAVVAPVMIYSVALKLPREQFMAVAGFLFFCGGLGLVGGLFTANLFNTVTFSLSVGAVLLALAGFRIGAWIRGHLSEKAFRLALLWLILALGLRLIAVNLW